jgi:hypothetical protein
MIDMANRPDIAMRLVAVELFLGHLVSLLGSWAVTGGLPKNARAVHRFRFYI